MRKLVITEIVWLLITAAVFWLLAVFSECKDASFVGMIVYFGVRVSYWYGKLNPL